MRVSVICTVLNEGESVRGLFDSLIAQTRPPDEVVVVDGGSSDSTLAVLCSYDDRLPVRVLFESGANISRGRNVAIAAASGDIIASTDAGVRLEPEWLACLVAPFEDPSQAASAVAGFFVPDPRSVFELAMGATVLPAADEVNPATFLPSSRSVAFRKSAWSAAGGYPEWLDYCEDLIFDFRLIELAGHFTWAPGAVAHFRPRGSWGAFWRQYYRYARGDGKADLWRRRHAIRYVTYVLALPTLLLLSITANGWWLLALAAGVIGYSRKPWRRLLDQRGAWTTAQRWQATLLVPLIRLVGDLAKMVGYPTGLLWRWRHRANPGLRWRSAAPPR